MCGHQDPHRPRRVVLEYYLVYFHSFLCGPKTPTTATSPTPTTSSTLMNNDHDYLRNENGYFDPEPNDYVHYYDYVGYFVHAPKTPVSP